MKRLAACAFFILVTTSCLKKEPDKFYNAYRSGKAVTAAISIGVNYLKFGELLIDLAKEVSIASDGVDASNKRDTEILKHYQEAVSIYHDSHKIWELKLDTSGPDELKGRVFVSKEVDTMVKKYGLPLEQVDLQYSSSSWSVLKDSEAAIQIMWEKAGEELKQAYAVAKQ